MKVAVVAVVCILQFSGVVHGANPNYSYHVKIDDPAHINFQEKAETRKGEDAQGFYSVLEPNGALRTVSYIADERGFNPIVSYSYGHPQSSVAVHSATGPAAILHKPGVYAPAYVADNRVQIVDKSNIYAAPPPALNLQTFALPGPSAPVIVPQPLRQVAPVIKASAAIATNYAPAFVPSPAAYLPPPPPPQVLAVAAPPPQPIAVALPAPQYYEPPSLSLAPPPVFVAKEVHHAKVLAVPAEVPAVKVVKTAPAVAAIVKDSYSEPPRDTFRDPNAPSYPDAVKVVKEPTADYGPPEYLPPPVVSEPTREYGPPPAVKVRVVQPKVKVVQPVIQQQVAVALPPPPPVVAVQKVVAPPAIALNPGLYAGAIGYHTHTVDPNSYIHNYGTQGFQVTSSRKFNKAVLAVPAVPKQVVQEGYSYVPPAKVFQPAPVYGPPAIQKVVEPPPVYGPPAIAVQSAPEYLPPPVQKVVEPVYGPPARVIEPRPVYGPPANVVHHQQYHQEVFHAAPLPQYVQPPQQVAIAQPIPAPVAIPAAPLAIAQPAPVAVPLGKKQNPLTFAYSYDQGGAKVTHSYSGSGW